MPAKFSLGSIKLLALKQQLWRIQRHLSKRVLLLEFRADSLIVAQFQLLPSGLRLCGFVREQLPLSAVQRGVPADPTLMAELISSLCKEQLLVAHRAVVVLPPEAVHLSSHWLPSGLDQSMLQHQLLEPAPPVLLPFPLAQTDFDVLLHACLDGLAPAGKRLWSILAVASRLSDSLLQCLQLADQECIRVELSYLSLLRCAGSHLASLDSPQTLLLLDLDVAQTHVVVATSDGPLQADRLTAIRAYPHGDPDAQEYYLPLAEVDLQAFVDDLKQFIAHVQDDPELPCKVHKIVVAGVNSAHPNIVHLLESMVSLPVAAINLFELPFLDGLDQLAFTESCFLHRMAGAAISLSPQLIELALNSEVQTIPEVAPPSSAAAEVMADPQPLIPSADEQAVELAMYQDPEISTDLPPDEVMEPPTSSLTAMVEQPLEGLSQIELDQPVAEKSEELNLSLMASDPPVNTAPLINQKAQQITPTDDPSTWPSVGKRRRRMSAPQSPETGEAATPWMEPQASNTSHAQEASEARLFSSSEAESASTVRESTFLSAETPTSNTLTSEVEGEPPDGRSGLFSFGSDQLADLSQPADVVDESSDDSDYSLGLGEPD